VKKIEVVSPFVTSCSDVVGYPSGARLLEKLLVIYQLARNLSPFIEPAASLPYLLVPILIQMNPAHTFRPFPEDPYYTLTFTTRSSEWPLSFLQVLRTKFCVHISGNLKFIVRLELSRP